MKKFIPANSNRNVEKISSRCDNVGWAAEAVINKLRDRLNAIDRTCDRIYVACEDGSKARAFKQLAKLKGQVEYFDAVSAIIAAK